MQPQIAYRLSEAPATPGQAAAAPDRQTTAAAAAESPQPVFSQTVQLQLQSAQQLETALMRSLGDRMSVARSAGPGGAAYYLHLSGGGVVTVELNYAANCVMVQGNGTSGPSAYD